MKFRAVNLTDTGSLFEWRNSPAIWRYYLNPRAVSADEHEKWFNSIISHPTKKIYIALVEDQPAGYIRFDVISPSIIELSWCLAQKFHGKGLGKRLLREGLKANPFPQIKQINAIIHNDNLASVKIAESNGFKLTEKSEPFSTYQLLS